MEKSLGKINVEVSNHISNFFFFNERFMRLLLMFYFLNDKQRIKNAKGVKWI